MMKHPLKLMILIVGLQSFCSCSPSTPQLSLDGLRKSFYQGGQLESEKTYLNGELSGPSRVYYKNGQIAWEGSYLNGKLDGSAKFFYDNAAIQAQRNYDDGVQTGQTKIFSKTGTLMAVYAVENGRRHGESIYLYESGVPLKKETYVKGIKEGPETIFGRDGSIKLVRNYRNGMLIGEPPTSNSDIDLNTQTAEPSQRREPAPNPPQPAVTNQPQDRMVSLNQFLPVKACKLLLDQKRCPQINRLQTKNKIFPLRPVKTPTKN
jgi:hypothetical protein